MTADASEDVVPSWSGDGRWIYFASNRSGSWQVWKVPFDGGARIQLTRRGGFAAFESADRQWVYYALSRSQPGLYRVPVDGGREEPVLDRLKPGYWGYWSLGHGGIYFLDAPRDTEPPSLNFYGFSGGLVRRLAAIDRDVPLGDSGMALSPDGRNILYTQIDQSGSDIMLADFGPH
jgi:Tol biopolymer transport system component